MYQKSAVWVFLLFLTPSNVTSLTLGLLKEGRKLCRAKRYVGLCIKGSIYITCSMVYAPTSMNVFCARWVSWNDWIVPQVPGPHINASLTFPNLQHISHQPYPTIIPNLFVCQHQPPISSLINFIITGKPKLVLNL